MFKVCGRNFKLYNFEVECVFCSLSASLFPWIPIWLGIIQKMTIFTLIRCIIYPRCMDDQYSYYDETLNRKV